MEDIWYTLELYLIWVQIRSDIFIYLDLNLMEYYFVDLVWFTNCILIFFSYLIFYKQFDWKSYWNQIISASFVAYCFSLSQSILFFSTPNIEKISLMWWKIKQKERASPVLTVNNFLSRNVGNSSIFFLFLMKEFFFLEGGNESWGFMVQLFYKWLVNASNDRKTKLAWK